MKHLERALQGRNGIGWYILMLVIIYFAAQIATIPLIFVLLPILAKGGGVADVMRAIQNPAEYGISLNLYLAIMMLSFVILYFAFALLVKPLHERTVRETINGRKKIRWNRVWMGIAVWGGLTLASFAVSLSTASPGDFEFQFNVPAFFGLLAIILIMMPFQTSIEEIIFRGYLAQGVGNWTKSRWWALIIPSVLFALMHSANPEVMKFGFWISMPNYLLMGLMLGLISILDDGIEIALGIHFINNAFAAIFVTHDASVLQTDALFVTHNIDPVASIIETAILATLAVVVLWRVYKWNFGIMNKMVEATPPPLPITEFEHATEINAPKM